MRRGLDGRLEERLLPDGGTEAWEYDAEGRLTAERDVAGAVSRFEFGPFGLLRARTMPDGERHTFGYDTELRLTSVCGPDGRVWSYEYDPAGRLVAETSFDGRLLDYRHDAAGQLVAKIGAGAETRFAYTPNGALAAWETADGLTTIEHSPAADLPLRIAGPDAVVEYVRDEMGRVLAETVDGRTVRHEYDALGRRIRRITPSGVVSTWAYDGAGRPVALESDAGAVRFAYDAAGREVHRSLGALVLAQSWDVADRLTGRLLAPAGTDGQPDPQRSAQRRTYGYRGDSTLESVADLLHGDRRFELSPGGRVTGVEARNWTQTYVYDGLGNITRSSDSAVADDPVGGDRAYSGVLLRSAGRRSYEYDERGRVVLVRTRTLSGRRRERRYEWDAEDRLTRVILPDGALWAYRYDPLGRRIAKQRLGADGATVVEEARFVWDDAPSRPPPEATGGAERSPSLNSFGSDAAALEWVGQTADAFKSNYGPLPGRLQKLYTSYSEASDALSAYAPKLQAAQSKADLALRQAQDAHADLQRATTNATNAAADLKTAQQNHAASPNPQAVTDAQTAHDTAQTNLNSAKARMADLAKQAEDAYNDRIAAAKDCAKAVGHAQSDGIHNKHWWEHIGADLAEWGGKIAEIANDLAPFLDVLALATSWIPGVDVITAGLAEADNLIALAGTGLEIAGDAMQGHWGDALMGAGMLGLTFLGGKAIGSLGGKLAGKLGREAEEGAEGAAGAEARTAEGNGPAICKDDPIDVVSGWMLTDETDLTLPGTLPVVLRRAYSSGYGMGRLFGPGWASTMDQRLSINEAGVHFAGDDAQCLDYPVPGQGEEVLPGRGNRWPLSWDREIDEIRIFDPFTGIARHFATVHYQDEHGQIRDLTAISDRNGNRINFLRDAHGTPIAVEHPAYRIDVDTVLTATGPRIAGLRLHDGTENGIDVKKFSYDERGRLTGVVDSSDLPLRYTWDDSDRITAWIDRVGYRYVYEYDALGRVVRTSGDGGFMSGTFVYDIDGRTTVHTSSLGNATIFRYDDAGHVLSETDPLGNTVFTEYDLEGRLLRRSDALGNSSVYEIDERGDTIAGRRPDGSAVVAEYTALHKVAVIRLPDGAEWQRHYDHRGNLLTVTDPTGATTTFEYGDRGVLLSAADALGAVTGYETNPAGLPLKLVDPLGAVTHLVRDTFGRVVRVTDPMGAVTECAWTVEGRPTWRVEPDGGRTEWAYDAEGRLLSLTSPGGAVTAYENGPFGTVTARMEADGNRYEFAFDAELRPIRVTNAAGAAWSYAHDPAGRLVSETDFIGRTVDYAYDASGRMRLRTDAAGGRVEFERDTNGLVARRRIPDGEFGYEYDAMGRLLRATGPGSEIVYARDAAGRVVSETVDGRTTAYEFDRAGRRVRRTTPAGVTSTWTYDTAGRPAALQAGSTELSFLHDAAGREVERAFAGGARLERRLDAAGRLGGLRLWAGDRSGASEPDAAASERLVFGREWDYRSDGIPVEIRDSLSGTRRYTADSVGRIQGVDAGTWTESYAYDAFGNLSQAASSLDGDANGTAVFETERTLIRQTGRTRYEHDAAGRLVRAVRRTLDGRRKVWAYSWDGEDRLVQVVTPDGATWRYSYDPLGRRTAKTRISPDGVETERVRFVWDGVRLAEQSAVDADATVTTLTWDYEPGTFAPAAQRRRSRLADAEQRVVDEAFYAIITDLAGAPTELVTADGRIAWRTVTSLWGRTLSTTADHGTDCPLRFAGQYHDTETGLHYNLNRYYDPDTAAYLSPDPLGLAPAPNDHAYVANPLTWIDPLGLACVKTDTGLGFQGHGAKEWAEKNGFMHYMTKEYTEGDLWKGAVRSDLANPSKTIHVLTEGFGPEGFEGMAVAGLKPGARATEQEMGWAARSVIHGQRSWDSIHFYDKNGRIFPDEPQWYDPKWEKAWILEEV